MPLLPRKFFAVVGRSAVAVCIFAATLSECSERERPAETAAKNGTLLIGNAADPASLDPSLTTGSAEFKILSGLFEGLVCADTKSLKIRPAVAKSWKISPDKTKYTFYLDEKAKWSDGSQVEAEDFVFAWRRTLNPIIGAEYASMLFVIKNAAAYNAGKIKNPDEIGVRAIGTNTLEVELERPAPYFLSMLYHNVFFPLPRRTLEKFGAQAARDTLWTRPQNIVCNGPFVLEKWSINDRVALKRNPFYRAKDELFLNRVEFLPISNINTEDRAFRAGQLHITDSVAPSRLASTIADAPHTLRRDKWLGVYYYLLNTSKPPLDNPLVRKALAKALDRRAIIDSFLKAKQEHALSFVPQNCDGYILDDRNKIAENVADARKLLALAGYPDGRNFPTIRITYNTSEQHKPIAEAVQQMWKKNLGIDVELYNLSWPAYLSARKNGDFEVARASWVGDYAAPESFLEIFISDSGLNHSRYNNKKFDELVVRAAKAETNGERLAILAEAESAMLRDMPVIPIYFYSKVYRISPLVKGWNANLLDYHNFLGVRLAAPENGGAK